jgi:hypothetical protein
VPDAVHLHAVAVDDVLAAVRALIDLAPYPVDELDGGNVFVHAQSLGETGAKPVDR